MPNVGCRTQYLALLEPGRIGEQMMPKTKTVSARSSEQQLLDLVRQGYTFTEIAQLWGTSRQRVRHMYRRTQEEFVTSGITRWRGGLTDPPARAAHNRETRNYRRRLSAAIIDPYETDILRALRSGASMVDAVPAHITAAQIYGRMRWDDEFRRRVENAQLEGRDPGIEHGTAMASRVHKCVCPECREHKHPPKGQAAR